MDFTHFDKDGNAVMVDVGEKQDTKRAAKAKGSIFMNQECLNKIMRKEIAKGDVLSVARIAGIMGAKRTFELIPLCHNLNLTTLKIEFQIREETLEIEGTCIARTVGKTGVEMEALTGITVALLTIYDMCKAVDKTMEIGNVYLCEKTGGKSGYFENPNKRRR